MARPMRDGFDYFSIDTDFLSDKKIVLLSAEFGDRCIKTILALLSRAYSENGYFVKFDFDDCLMMSQGVLSGQSAEYIQEVVQGCVRRSLFDQRVFDMFGVLTSQGIQRRYVNMAQKRSTIPMIQEYCLLDLNDKNQFADGVLVKVALKSVSVPKTGGFLSENAGFLSENQSKEKESKVKQSKVNTSPPVGGDLHRENNALFNQFWDAYPRKVSKKDALKAWDRLKVDDSLFSSLMDGLEKWKTSPDWTKDGGQFVPYPATFLRREQWDTPPTETQNTASLPHVHPLPYAAWNDDVKDDEYELAAATYRPIYKKEE